MKRRISKLISSLCMVSMLCSGTVFAEETSSLNNPVLTYNETKQKNVTTWDCVYFGTYPQSEVTSGDAIFTRLKTEENWQDNEVVIEGIKFRREKQPLDSAWNDVHWQPYFENMKNHFAYKWDFTPKELIDKNSEDLPYHYFQYEPIKWRVLEAKDGKALLLSDEILDCTVYHGGGDVLIGYEKKIAWDNSLIREYLNGYGVMENSKYSFAYSAFDEEEMNAIVPVALDKLQEEVVTGNAVNVLQEQVSSDKIFLLSMDEVEKSDESNLFEKNILRCATSTEYTWANGCYRVNQDYPMTKNTSNWWLRNDSYEYQGKLVCSNGSCGGADFYNDYTGVRPALYLDLDSDVYTYAGTVTTDYQLYGDFDKDDKVSLYDAQKYLKIALNIENCDETMRSIGDLDKDGNVSLEDTMSVLKMALNIEDKMLMD